MLDSFNEHLSTRCRYHIARKEQDAFALESQKKCKQAMEAGNFKSEIVPVTITRSDKRAPVSCERTCSCTL